ncbi:hypothetical protein BDV93DRAFT_557995 [Ceratobasidium sp. AG-I]|nr:hypothetical protein BDV93DRAFT_557995 [Ceratobasidium sp. AG-I]
MSFKKDIDSLDPSITLEEQYSTCPAASRATCRFVDNPGKLDVRDLKLYKREIPGSDGRDLVIGIATQSPSGDLTPLVLIENDDSGRGIHFTGTAIYDPSRNYVACLRHSATLHPVYRHYIYLDYVRSLQNRSASFIWDWWRSGQDMDGLDQMIRDGR